LTGTAPIPVITSRSGSYRTSPGETQRDAIAITEINLSNCAALPWAEQAKVAFDDAEQGDA
jgi:hypothetical protein